MSTLLRRTVVAVAACFALLAAAGPAAAQEGPVDVVATHEGSTAVLPLLVDPFEPQVQILSPQSGSVVGGGTITITGTVEDAFYDPPPDRTPLFGEVTWRVQDANYITVGSGTAPVVDGRFTIPDVLLGTGNHSVFVQAVDAAGNQESAFLSITSDPAAPPVALVAPKDGQVLTAATTSVDLNFAAPTTLVSVNGVADGRSFPAGFAADALTLTLEFGPNPVTLELQSSEGTSTHAFTLFRVDQLAGISVQSVADGGIVGEESLTVRGTVPLGTTLVEVNGVLVVPAADGVRYEAEVPLSEGPNDIRVTAYPQNDSHVIRVIADFTPPAFLAYVPDDGAISLDPEAAFAGFVTEPARVEAIGPQGTVAVRTVAEGGSGGIGTLFSPLRHRFDLAPLGLDEGANPVTLRATDAAGNVATEIVTLERATAALRVVSPAPGSSVATLRADVQLEALAPLTLDAFFVSGARMPSAEGYFLPGGSTFTLPAVPLQSGENDLRLVYSRDSGPSEVLEVLVTSTASNAATLTGTVEDASTGDPVAGALVSYTVDGVTLVTVTGDDGRFEVEVEAGAVEGVVTSEGYASTTFEAEPSAGGSEDVTVPVESTGIPAIANEVEILVPPDGTVTDWEQVTVVGEVLNPASQVTVNGVAAKVVGSRFTARGVALAEGPNQIEATATALGSPTVTTTVAVEHADQPVLDVVIFSPPEGASVPGNGLLVRGFVSARQALTVVDEAIAPAEQGVFAVPDIRLPEGETTLTAFSRIASGEATDRHDVPLTLDAVELAIRLRAEPGRGTVPLVVSLQATSQVPLSIESLHFDFDGDLEPDTEPVAGGEATTTYATAGPRVPRALAVLEGGTIELSAVASVHAFEPAELLTTFAAGNPVDLVVDGAELLVLDAAGASVARYDREGNLLGSFGSGGAGPDQMAGPQALAVEGEEIFVADTGNGRVQVFSRDGTHLRSLGSGGLLSAPRGVGLDGGIVLVSDTDRIQVLSTDGAHLATIPVASPRGIAAVPGFGLVVSSPVEGLISVVSEGGSLLVRHLAGSAEAVAAPVDVAVGGPGVLVAEGGTAAVALLSRRFRVERVVQEGLTVPARAVANGLRREVPSVLVADGSRVLEVALPVPSPLPAVEALRDRLAAGDADGALELIVPVRRPVFEQIYDALGPDLPHHAAALGEAEVSELGPERAEVRIEVEVQMPGGGTTTRRLPMYMTRAEDGSWRVYDY